MTTAQLLIKKLAASYPEGYTADALAKMLEKSKRTVQRALSEIRASMHDGDEGAPELIERPGPHGKIIYSLLEVVDDEEIARWAAAAGGDSVAA